MSDEKQQALEGEMGIPLDTTNEHDKSYENETPAPSPMVQISLKEYDKLKEQSKFITDPNMIAIVDKIGELLRALRKNIRMPL